MVGLVLVSHSRNLADALLNYVRQRISQEAPIARTAGVGPTHQDLGTDPVEIAEAIRSVYSTEGVVVLMDMQETFLNVEQAVQLLPEEMQSNIRLCPAPLLEGTIVASTQVCAGSNAETVCQAARGALSSKTEQCMAFNRQAETWRNQLRPQPAGGFLDIEPESVQEMILTIHNQHGIHVRPAARFVQTAKTFDAEIHVRRVRTAETVGEEPAEASVSSLSSLAILGIAKGDQIAVLASGKEALQALQALRRLVEEELVKDFDQQTEPVKESYPPESLPPVPTMLESQVIPISDGIAIGPVFQYHAMEPNIPEHQIEDPVYEWEYLLQAITRTRQTIQQRRQHVSLTVGKMQAAIFDAHLLTLEDKVILDRTRKLIFQQSLNAAAAWNASIQEIVKSYQNLADPYQQQRAVDVLDVGREVLFALLENTSGAVPAFAHPVVVVAKELTPTMITQLDTQHVLGVVMTKGGPTDHSAILIRALGIPSIVVPSAEESKGRELSVLTIPAGTRIALDGFDGKLWITPSSETIAELQKRQADWQAYRDQLFVNMHQPSVTRDGHRLSVAANVGSIDDAKLAIYNGSEGIGVLRTEFLYLARTDPPSEEEQVITLTQIAETIGDHPIIVRTLDVGGDKAIPYLNLPVEANPYLGVRSIRFSLRNPDLFHTQLRAILRAGANADVWIMFPMVTMVEEVARTLQCLERAHQTLEQDHLPHRWPIKTGMMVETPGAALLTSIFANALDFFSIGTNDLTQYTLAAERGNFELVEYADALHPTILHLIQVVVEAAHQQGKWVSICGELAGDPVAAPVLVGLGVDDLSLNPRGVPYIKAIIRQMEMTSAVALAKEALQSGTATDVRRMAKEFIARLR